MRLTVCPRRVARRLHGLQLRDASAVDVDENDRILAAAGITWLETASVAIS
jgi:hypothetical protein